MDICRRSIVPSIVPVAAAFVLLFGNQVVAASSQRVIYQFPPAPPCDSARHVKQLNLPPGETSKETEIVHATAVICGGKLVGSLLQTVRGQLFYQDGPGSPSQLIYRQPLNVARAMIQALGLQPASHNQRGGIYTVTTPLRLAPIANMTIELKGCY